VNYFIGIDIGSSSIKVALLEGETGNIVGFAYSPESEMEILCKAPGFAEQDPEMWWEELIHALSKLHELTKFNRNEIAAIGISYQMHGLVCLDKDLRTIRPSIIWCDSRAVEVGERAFDELGHQHCLEQYLNSPGNFTISKLKWVQLNEPEVYDRIYKIMLPGDFIALKMTGESNTTLSGLSEGIFWNYKNGAVADELFTYFGLDSGLLPRLTSTFGFQGGLTTVAAKRLGLQEGTPVSYRAGDQPNNAFSLNVLNPGEVAANAGTSGVVYGITDKIQYDWESRINPFIHVNNSDSKRRLGMLLCVNGTGILNSWLRKTIFHNTPYAEMNAEASKVPIGADGLLVYPFGNGSERLLGNKTPGASFKNLQFNLHGRGHLARGAQEGIVFALNYGIEIMKDLDIPVHTIRAGKANMFLSEVFSFSLSNASGCVIELFNTDGASGAARGAALGSGFYATFDECFKGMQPATRVEPDKATSDRIGEIYHKWKMGLQSQTK